MSAENFSLAKSVSEEFPVVEAHLAEKLGIPRKLITIIRQEVLQKDRDWRLVDKEIRLTEAAVRRIWAGYGSLKNTPANDAQAVLSEKKADPLAETAAPPFKVAVIEFAARESSKNEASSPTVELIVKKRCETNPKIVWAYSPHGGDPVVVRVQTSTHWMSQMPIRARKIANGIYERVGRDPRWRGEKV
jgi:hypothetical protein